MTFDREGLSLVVRNVPAQVCENCGEKHVDEAEAERLLATAEDATRLGVKVDVREYTAA